MEFAISTCDCKGLVLTVSDLLQIEMCRKLVEGELCVVSITADISSDPESITRCYLSTKSVGICNKDMPF